MKKKKTPLKKAKMPRPRKTYTWGRLLLQMALGLGAAALASTMLTYLEEKQDREAGGEA